MIIESFLITVIILMIVSLMLIGILGAAWGFSYLVLCFIAELEEYLGKS